MVRKSFENEMKNLNLLLMEMGSKVDNLIKVTIESLLERSRDKAITVKSLDDEIDELEAQIEEKCIELFALQGPVAKDLRMISSVLKIITDLERVGDYGVNIANIVATSLVDKEPMKKLIDIPEMARIVQQMTRNSLSSFINKDLELARETAKTDEKIDKLYEDISVELLGLAGSRQEIAEEAMHLLFVARYLERMGDHVTNICERIIYIYTAEKVTY